MKKELEIKRPKGWRKGQAIFNFLEWIRKTRQDGIFSSESGRMADPYSFDDRTFDELYKKFLKENEH